MSLRKGSFGWALKKEFEEQEKRFKSMDSGGVSPRKREQNGQRLTEGQETQ